MLQILNLKLQEILCKIKTKITVCYVTMRTNASMYMRCTCIVGAYHLLIWFSNLFHIISVTLMSEVYYVPFISSITIASPSPSAHCLTTRSLLPLYYLFVILTPFPHIPSSSSPFTCVLTRPSLIFSSAQNNSMRSEK